MPSKIQVISTVLFPLTGGHDASISTGGSGKFDLKPSTTRYRWDSSAQLQTQLAARLLIMAAFPNQSVRAVTLIGTSPIQTRGPKGYHVNWVWEVLCD